MNDDYARAAMHADTRSKANYRNVEGLAEAAKIDRARVDQLISDVRQMENSLASLHAAIEQLNSRVGLLIARQIGSGPTAV